MLVADWKFSAVIPSEHCVDITFSHARLQTLSSVLAAAVVDTDDAQKHVASFVVNLCAGRVPNAAWVVDKVATPASDGPAGSVDVAPAGSGAHAHHVKLDTPQQADNSSGQNGASLKAAMQQQFDPDLHEPPPPGLLDQSPTATAAASTMTLQHVTGHPTMASTAVGATPLPAHSAGPAAGAAMPFPIPAASMQQPGPGAANFTDSATVAADMLHGILVQAAKAKGEDTSAYVQKAIKNPTIMQVWRLLPADCHGKKGPSTRRTESHRPFPVWYPLCIARLQVSRAQPVSCFSCPASRALPLVLPYHLHSWCAYHIHVPQTAITRSRSAFTQAFHGQT